MAVSEPCIWNSLPGAPVPSLQATLPLGSLLLSAAAVFENLDSSDVMETPAFPTVMKLLEVTLLFCPPASFFCEQPQGLGWQPLPVSSSCLPGSRSSSPLQLPCGALQALGVGIRPVELIINKVSDMISLA